MPARFNAYPPDRAALVRLLEENRTYRIGRAADCELHIDHPSISRFHAELQSDADETWSLHDTGSKNGVRVDGHMVSKANLARTSWFAIGDVYCSLERLDPAAADLQRAQEENRRGTSRWLSSRLSPSLGIGTLIAQTLDIVIELAGLDRGFILFAPEGEPLRVHASRGLPARDIAKADFAGSVTAVERALTSGQSVVCCDTNESPWLGARPSVRLGGIRGIVCAPLRIGDNTLGVIYADSRTPGPPVTELDLELIENVAGHAAAALATRQLRGDMADVLRSAADAGMIAPRWDELLRQPPKG
ncbi:MAG TPA: GAF domain-containing protein [Rudaea sp.]